MTTTKNRSPNYDTAEGELIESRARILSATQQLKLLDEIRKLRQDNEALRTRAENAENDLARIRGWGN